MNSATPPTPEAPAGEPATPRRRRLPRRLRRAIIIAIAVVVLVRLGIWIAMPTIVEKALAGAGYASRYEELDLSLLGADLELWHLEVTPLAGDGRVAHLEYCRADIEITALLRGELVVRRLEIDGMDVVIERQADGSVPAFGRIAALAGLGAPPAAPAPAAAPAAPEAEPWRPSTVPVRSPLRLDALRLQHIQTLYRDLTVDPPLEVAFDVSLRLSNLGDARHAPRFSLDVASPTVLDRLSITGGVDELPGAALRAHFDLAARGAHPQAIEPLLARVGIAPRSHLVTADGRGEIRIERLPAAGDDESPIGEGLRAELALEALALRADGAEAAAIDRARIAIAARDGGALRIEALELDGGRATVRRSVAGAIGVAGLEPSPRQDAPPAEVAPDEAPRASAGGGTATTSLLERIEIDAVAIENCVLRLLDDAIEPPASIVLVIDELRGETTRRGGGAPSETDWIARIAAPGIIEDASLRARCRARGLELDLDAAFSASGIAPLALEPYLDAAGLR